MTTSKTPWAILVAIQATGIMTAHAAWECTSTADGIEAFSVEFDSARINASPSGTLIKAAARFRFKSRPDGISFDARKVDLRCADCVGYLIDPANGKFGGLFFSVDEEGAGAAQVGVDGWVPNRAAGDRLECKSFSGAQ